MDAHQQSTKSMESPKTLSVVRGSLASLSPLRRAGFPSPPPQPATSNSSFIPTSAFQKASGRNASETPQLASPGIGSNNVISSNQISLFPSIDELTRRIYGKTGGGGNQQSSNKVGILKKHCQIFIN